MARQALTEIASPATVRQASATAPPVQDDDLRTRVTLVRTSPKDIGQRQIFARLDGGASLVLAAGDEFTLDIEPGRHRLRVHNTLFWKNVDFVVESGEHVEFMLVNWASWWTMTTAMWLGTGVIYLRVEKSSLR